MAVQILNDLPDAEVHRGDPVPEPACEPIAPRVRPARVGGRAGFLTIVIGLHVAAAFGLVQMTLGPPQPAEPAAIEAALIDAPADSDLPPPDYTPPPVELVYTVPAPQELDIETDAITTPLIASTQTEAGSVSPGAPPMVESVEYIRTEPPVYPKESQRKREHGTVLLRVLVDAFGRPAQIQVERSSGFARLDAAAREAVEKFLFRPYEVNGVAQPAQVLIPIGFDRRSS